MSINMIKRSRCNILNMRLTSKDRQGGDSMKEKNVISRESMIRATMKHFGICRLKVEEYIEREELEEERIMKEYCKHRKFTHTCPDYGVDMEKIGANIREHHKDYKKPQKKSQDATIDIGEYLDKKIQRLITRVERLEKENEL